MINSQMDHLRYVILRHDRVPEPHFDLMFEAAPGADLITWRSLEWPITQETNLTRLGEHRRAYLDYEGPVSNDRGDVKRVEAGTCHIDWTTAHECTIHIDDRVLALRLLEDDHWLATPTS